MNNHKFKVLLSCALLFAILLYFGNTSALAVQQEVYHYYSKNLSGHTVSPEQVGTMPVYQSDVGITSYADYGVVRSNVPQRNVYVNAIGNTKWTDNLPSGTPIHPAIYKYKYQIKLPVVPTTTGTQIPQATHMMITYWDGADRTFTANKTSLEATIYWSLNPWDTSTFGHLFVYTNGITLQDTGVVVTPDTNWHSFELIANFTTKKYESMSIDGVYHSLSGINVGSVYHPEWGNDLSVMITTESMNCYPSSGQSFWWDTYFKELSFSELNWL